MRYVAFMRHGEPQGREDGSGLTETGKMQADAMGNYIRSMAGNDACVMASPVERARQTAERLANALGCGFKTRDYLADGTPEIEAYEALMKDMKANPVDCFIAVSHKVTCMALSFMYAREIGAKGIAALAAGLDAGQAYFFDLQKKTVKIFPDYGRLQ